MMFIVGLVFSWQTARQVQKTGYLFFNKYFGVLFLFQTLVLMPQAIYYYVAHPDWCWMYWTDSRKVPLSIAALTYLSYYPSMISGYALGFYLEKKKTHLSFTAIKISILFLLLFAVFAMKRLFYIGTLEQFHSNSTTFILFLPSLFVMVFGGMAISIFILLHILRYLGKELDVPFTAKAQKPNPVVAIQKVSEDVEEAIKLSLQTWNGLQYLQRLIQEKGKKVLIKPNFAGGGKDKRGTQTSKEVLEAVVEILREIQQDVEIFMVESGSIFWRDMDPLIKGSVYEKLFLEKNLQFVNLSRARTKEYDFGGRMGKDEVPEILLTPHVLVDVPVAKTHAYFKMSGALKNLFGLLPEGFKLFRYHAGKGLDDGGRIFLDIYRNFPPDLVIVDGMVSCEGHGPYGTPKETNFIITSSDAVCTDFVLSEIMGYNKEEVPYLKALLEDGFSPDFTLSGDPVEHAKPRNWKHTGKFLGLHVNFYRILWEHLKSF